MCCWPTGLSTVVLLQASAWNCNILQIRPLPAMSRLKINMLTSKHLQLAG